MEKQNTGSSFLLVKWNIDYFGYLRPGTRASLVAQTVKNLPAMQKTWVPSLGWEDPWRREWQPTPLLLPGELHGQRSLENTGMGFHALLKGIFLTQGSNPCPYVSWISRWESQYSCLGNPMDREAWQATVHEVIKESDTTKQLNNSNFLNLEVYLNYLSSLLKMQISRFLSSRDWFSKSESRVWEAKCLTSSSNNSFQ